MDTKYRLIIVVTIIALASGGVYWWMTGQDPAPEAPTSQDSQPTPPVQPAATEPKTPAAPASDRTADEQISISGIALDSERKPVAEVTVLYNTIEGRDDCNALTDSPFEISDQTQSSHSDRAGRFRLAIPERLYNSGAACVLLNASKPGYYETTVTLPWLAEADALDQQQVEVELQAHRRISGQVFAPGGEPVGDARVLAWPSVYSDDAAAESACEQASEADRLVARSNNRGAFQLDLVQTGRYCVRASHPEWASSEATMVDGETDTLTLTLQSSLQFSGEALDNNNVPVADLSLSLEPQNGARDRTLTTRTDGAGRFSFRSVDFGSYQLITTEDDYAVAAPQRPITITESVSDFLVKVYPLALLQGHVVDSRGEPLKGVRVSAGSPFATKDLWTQTTTNARGEFELPSKHQSQQVRDMQKLAGAFADAANNGSTVCVDFFHPDYRSKLLAIPVNNSIAELDTIYLQAAVTQVNGQVLNHRGQAVSAELTFHYRGANTGADSLNAMPGCDDIHFERTISTDEQGRFSLHLQNLGEYELQVQTRNYRERRVPLSIGASDKTLTIQLD